MSSALLKGPVILSHEFFIALNLIFSTSSSYGSTGFLRFAENSYRRERESLVLLHFTAWHVFFYFAFLLLYILSAEFFVHFSPNFRCPADHRHRIYLQNWVAETIRERLTSCELTVSAVHRYGVNNDIRNESVKAHTPLVSTIYTPYLP